MNQEDNYVPAPANWGKPSHIEAEWERRDQEGIGFQCRAYDHPLQYKIDIWTLTGKKGEYRMRLDGFGHLRLRNADSLGELINYLLHIPVSEVINAYREHHHMMVQAYKQWKAAPDEFKSQGSEWPEPMPEIPELVIKEYFEAARTRTVHEMYPLLHFGNN